MLLGYPASMYLEKQNTLQTFLCPCFGYKRTYRGIGHSDIPRILMNYSQIVRQYSYAFPDIIAILKYAEILRSIPTYSRIFLKRKLKMFKNEKDGVARLGETYKSKFS